MSELDAMIASIKSGLSTGTFGGFTDASVTYLQNELAAVEAEAASEIELVGRLQSAQDALVPKNIAEPDPGVFNLTAKSALAKIGKLQPIPFTWDGGPVKDNIKFVSASKAVCNVTADGTLVPMKAGTAVIMITAPRDQFAVLAVTVSA